MIITTRKNGRTECPRLPLVQPSNICKCIRAIEHREEKWIRNRDFIASGTNSTIAMVLYSHIQLAIGTIVIFLLINLELNIVMDCLITMTHMDRE